MNDQAGRRERDQPQGDEQDQPQIREAEQKRSRFPGWIWSIPVAALGLVAWLLIRGWLSGGPTVEVIFPELANLRPDDTKVKFEDMDVGQVTEVHVAKDLKHMRVRLEMDSDMQNHLGPGTQFWIIGKQVGFANLTAIKAMIEGVSIGISPRPGKKQAHYEGLAEQPVIRWGETGTPFTLHASERGSIDPGTSIYYLGQKVGKVVDVKMTGPNAFDIEAFVDRPYDALVHAGSRFWRSGPVHLSMGANGPTVRFQSIPALFQGAIAFETPSGAEGPPAAAGAAFQLYDDEDAAKGAPDSDAVRYRVVFHNATGVPAQNAPVDLMGKRVGTVADSELQYNAGDGHLSVLATIVLEPTDIRLADNASWTNPRGQMDDLMRHLIGQGLRAELSKSPPLIGGLSVSLHMVPGKSGTLGEGAVPEIPTSEGGSIAGVVAQASDVMAKVNEMPLDQIANNLRDISQHLAKLTSSPELQATLTHIDRATDDIQQIAREAKQELPPALADLRRTVAEAQKSLAAAQDLISARGTAASTPGTEGLPQALYELSRAARAVRELADYLDRHPAALLVGRGANQ
jgi:paraquat-inducible protein B